jgi:precorrin-6B methylase 2
MRAFGRSEAVARHGASGRRHERALSLAPAAHRDGAKAVQRRRATPQPVTTEGGIVRFGSSRVAARGAVISLASQRAWAPSGGRKTNASRDTKEGMDGIFGQSSFSGIRLLTAPGRVMTPRQATEHLVERAVARLGSAPARVADVGSGSGAIAVAIALRAPNAEVWATDHSEAAVELTRANVARYGLAHRVRVARGDLLEPVPGLLDLIVANLPYLPESLRLAGEYADLLAEPAAAVFAPGDGLGPYRRLLDASPHRLTPRGALLVQFRGRILEATCCDFDDLLTDLEQRALAA